MGDILADMSCPNITGVIGVSPKSGAGWFEVGGTGGAFTTGSYSEDFAQIDAPISYHRGQNAISIDASVAHSAYSGSSVQPSALQLLACIRC